MIYYDHTEAREGSKLPNDVIAYGKPYPNLEQITGGDLVIVPELSPADEVRIGEKSKKQLSEETGLSVRELLTLGRKSAEDILFEYTHTGAVIVQRKSGFDLISSIHERLDDSLARMMVAAPNRCQRILLYTGVFDENNGDLVFNGKRTSHSYWSVQMALTAYGNKGGRIVNLPRDSMILDWCKFMEKKLLSYKHKDTKWIIPTVYYPPDYDETGSVFQVPVAVNDGRKTLATFPNWGPDKVNLLWEHLKEKFEKEPTTFFLLMYATNYNTAKVVKGIGEKAIKSAREWLGIHEDDYLIYIDNSLVLHRERR
jgi:hypothetical protein